MSDRSHLPTCDRCKTPTLDLTETWGPLHSPTLTRQLCPHCALEVIAQRDPDQHREHPLVDDDAQYRFGPLTPAEEFGFTPR